MKKLLSFLLVACMLAVAFNVPVFADVPTDGLVVDVNLAAYNGTAASITNNVSGQNTVFTIGGTPVKGSFANKQGTTTSYLQLGEVDSSGVAVDASLDRYLNVSDEDMLGQTATTVSFWMYDEGCRISSYSRYFMLTNGNNRAYGLRYNGKDGDQVSSWDKDFGTGGPEKNSNLGKRDECWKLVTITRTFDSVKGTQSYYAQVNTVGKNPATASLTTDALTSRKSETGFFFQFGSGIPCKIGGIKMYNRALESDEITALFDAEKALYEAYEETATEMLLTSPTAGGRLPNTNGSIALNFNTIPDSATLGGITLKKDGSGANMLGTPSANGMTVTLPYSNLERGARYELVVSGVKSMGGLEMEPASFWYDVASDSSLVVDVNIDDYDNANVSTIKNKIAGGDTTFAFGEGKPVKGSFANKQGTITSYLQFGEMNGSEFDSTTANRELRIADSGVLDETATTITFWVYDDAANTPFVQQYKTYLFMKNESNHRCYALRRESSSADNLRSWEANGYNITSANQESCSYSRPAQVWKQVTVVRSWDETTKTQTYTVDVKPVAGNGSNATLTTGAISSRLSESDFYYQFGLGVPAKIAGIKMYNKALDSDEITALFNAEKALYTEYPLDITFTNADGTEVDGFNGEQGSITASFTLENDGEEIQEVLLIMALYNGDELVASSVPVSDSIGIGSDKELGITMSVPSNIEYNSNYKLKLFIWENLETLQPLFPARGLPYMADLPIPQEDGIYVFEHFVGYSLNPSTVLKSAFTLSNNNENSVDYDDIYYIPQNNTIRLTAESAELSEHTLTSDNSVLTSDGTGAGISAIVYPYFVKTAPTDAVTAISYRYFNGDTPVYDLENYSEFRVLIQVANTSGTSYVNRNYSIAIDGNPNRIVKSGTINIERDSVETIECEVNAELEPGEKLVLLI